MNKHTQFTQRPPILNISCISHPETHTIPALMLLQRQTSVWPVKKFITQGKSESTTASATSAYFNHFTKSLSHI